MTLDRYGHLFPDELQQLAERLQDAYADACRGPSTNRDLGNGAPDTQRGRSATCLSWWT
jgi:hypothetical protein